MDNRAADRHGEPGKKGFCFFQEDEDHFGLAVSSFQRRHNQACIVACCRRL